MNKLIVFTSTLHDESGYPVCSLNGDIDFIMNTYKQSIDNANVSDDLKKMLNNGTIRFHSVSVAIIDDNSVDFNVTKTQNIDINFNINYIEFPFDFKKFSYSNKKAVKSINSIIYHLEQECKKTYDLKKKEAFINVEKTN